MSNPKNVLPQQRTSRTASLRSDRLKNHGPTKSDTATSAVVLEASSSIPNTRDPSPTKLPVGSFRRANLVQKAAASSIASGVTSHKRHSSTSNIRDIRNDGPTCRRHQPTGLKSLMESPAIGPQNLRSKLLSNSGNTSKPSQSVPPRANSRDETFHTQDKTDKQDVRAGGINKATSQTRSDSTHLRTASLGLALTHSGDQKTTSNSTRANSRPEAKRSRGLVESSLELLQLHAIHSRSAKTQSEWKENARSHYEKQFKDIVAFKAAVQAKEQEFSLQRNASAIIEWGSRASGDTLEHRLQVFSAALDEAWQLSSHTGRYTATVQAFEHWYENVSHLQENSHDMSNVSQKSLNAAEGLGDGWKTEVTALQEVMLETANDVLSLGDIEGESDIARSITLLLELIKNMLEELELMMSIEQATVHLHREWLQTSLDQVDRNI